MQKLSGLQKLAAKHCDISKKLFFFSHKTLSKSPRQEKLFSSLAKEFINHNKHKSIYKKHTHWQYQISLIKMQKKCYTYL